MFKLSYRLSALQQLIQDSYLHIWDCCCDHGHLGMSLLTHQTAPNIHFVDIVPALMDNVKHTLNRFFSASSSAWKTHCLDVAQLPLAKHQGKHLVIIAGVGGDLMIEFIRNICQRHPTLTIDFLLCPVHHQFALRETLHELNYCLKNEILIEENKRFYEILLVSTQSNSLKNISPVGSDIWEFSTPQQARIAELYLAKTIAHYQRAQKKRAIEAYNAVTIRNTIIE